MRNKTWMAMIGMLALAGTVEAQRDRDSSRSQVGLIGDSQIQIGEEGVVWYATWDVAVKEATRSNRPIFFMAAACQKGSVSVVF